MTEENLMRQVGQQRSLWSGPFTFFRAPHTQDLTGVDIAVYGIPWGSLSYPWGDGTKFAPGVLREMTCRSAYPVLPHWPYSFNVNEVCKIVDYGDVEYGSNIHYMDVMLENLEATTRAVLDTGATPLSIAGDHSTTLGPMRAVGKKYDGKLGVIHLDAHNDAMGSEPITSASFDLMVDEGMVDPDRWITVGLRFAPSDYFSNIIYGNDCVRLGPKKTAERIREVVGDGPVFITFDVDYLNPTDFSSTSLPTPGGPGIHELRGLFYYLQGLNIVAADCVEYNPLLDNQGKRDGHQLAFLLTDLVALLAIARGKAELSSEFEW